MHYGALTIRYGFSIKLFIEKEEAIRTVLSLCPLEQPVKMRSNITGAKYPLTIISLSRATGLCGK